MPATIFRLRGAKKLCARRLHVIQQFFFKNMLYNIKKNLENTFLFEKKSRTLGRNSIKA